MTSILLAAAISGIVAGAQSETNSGRSLKTDLASSAQPMDDAGKGSKHACRGQNACKGQGGCKNDKHGCKGQNACKGQGGCKG